MDKTTDDGLLYLQYATNATLTRLTVNAGPHVDVSKNPNNLPLAIYSNHTQLEIDSSTINGAINSNGEDASLLIAKDSFLKGMLGIPNGSCILLRTEFAGGVDVENAVETSGGSKWGINSTDAGLIAVDCHLKGDIQLYYDGKMSFIGGTVEGDIKVRHDSSGPSVWFNDPPEVHQTTLEKYEIELGDISNKRTTFIGDCKITHKSWNGQDRGQFGNFVLKNCDIQGSLTIDAPVRNYSATGCTGTITKNT